MGRDRAMQSVYRFPGWFGPSQSTTTVKEAVFQDRLMSMCPKVSRACQISMVMEERKKNQHEHSCRKVYQGQLVSLSENRLLQCLMPKEEPFQIKTEKSARLI